MTLYPCVRCATPLAEDRTGCPACGATDRQDATMRPAAMVLMGLSLGGPGCIVQDLYGVAMPDSGMMADNDGDGYSVAEGDCDDDDPEVYPDADETPGDGVDSNCDGEDDT